ncbi:unnamed protein product, partial [Polarella glacialis]
MVNPSRGGQYRSFGSSFSVLADVSPQASPCMSYLSSPMMSPSQGSFPSPLQMQPLALPASPSGSAGAPGASQVPAMPAHRGNAGSLLELISHSRPLAQSEVIHGPHQRGSAIYGMPGKAHSSPLGFGPSLRLRSVSEIPGSSDSQQQPPPLRTRSATFGDETAIGGLESFPEQQPRAMSAVFSNFREGYSNASMPG